MHRGRRFLPYLLLLILTAIFFYQFVFFGRIPIDATPLYRMRPWSSLPEAARVAHSSDPARYYHNIDPIVEVLPIKIWLAEHLRKGDVPLWIDALFSGSPFAANHHAAPWDLSSLFFLFFPAGIAFGLTLLFHLFFASACMFFYCRVLGLSDRASLLGGLSFGFNSFFFHWLGLISFNAGLISMPLVPAGVELVIQRKKIRYGAITAIGLGLSFLSGMAQFWLFQCFLFGTYGLYRLITGSEKTKLTAACLIATVLGTGLGAVQLNQTLGMLSETSRGDSPVRVYEGRNHLSPRKVPTLLIPDLYGYTEENVFSKLLLKPSDPQAKGLKGRLIWGEKGSVLNRSWGYIGMVSFLLLFPAFILAKRPVSFYRWICAGVLLFQVSLCNEKIHRLFQNFWSGFDTLDHTRTIVLYVFGASILAADTLNRVAEWGKWKERLYRLCLIGAIGCLLIIIILQIVPVSISGSANQTYASEFFTDAEPKILLGVRKSATILVFPLIGFITLSLLLRGTFKPGNLQSGLVAFACIDLFYHGWTDPPLVYTSLKELQPQEGKIVEWLKKDDDIFRVMELHRKHALPEVPLKNYSNLERYRKGSVRFFDPRSVEFVYRPNTLLPAGIASAGGYMSLYPGRYRNLWQGRGMDILKVTQTDNTAEIWNQPWIGMQNIKYVLAAEETPTGGWKPVARFSGIQILPVQFYVPRLYVVPRARVVKDPLSEVKSPQFNPRLEVVLEAPDDFQVAGSGEYSLVYKRPSPDMIQIQAEMKGDGYLVIAENLFPGWKAFVNGVEQKLLRANYIFSCLPLKKGNYQISMNFEPKYYKMSLFISTASLGILVGLWLYSRFEKQ